MKKKNIYIYSWRPFKSILTKHPPSAGFLSPSGGAAPSAPVRQTAAFSGGERKVKNLARDAPHLEALKKVKNIWGACGAQNGFKNFRWAIKIPNMCLFLKLDKGKVVSIANEQNHRAIQCHISI